MKDNKKIIMILVVSLIAVASVILGIVFAKKSSKKSNNPDETTYKLNFVFNDNDIKISELLVDVKDKKIIDVAVTLFYDNADVANDVGKAYQDENEYAGITIKDNTVVLHYAENEIAKLAGLSKEQLINMFEMQGYKYMK